MIHLNAITSSPFLFALEPLNAICDYVAGHIGHRDLSLRGDGHPVLVFPGLGVSGAATADMRIRLQQLGYPVYDWKHGMNSGPGIDFDGWVARLGQHVQEIHDAHDTTVSLIGWSLGGTYARELAIRHPAIVRQVITLATPYGGPERALSSEEVKAQQREDSLHVLPCDNFPGRPTPVLTSSIYSQTDGIVNWEQCIGEETGHHRNIEVKGVSHFGMVHHPAVLHIVADLLKQ